MFYKIREAFIDTFINASKISEAFDLVSAKQSRTKGFPNVEGKFGAASRDAFTFDGGRSMHAACIAHGEEFVNADAVASSGEGLKLPESGPKSAGT